MKKGIVILLMVALCAFSAFAIDMSAGGGMDFTHGWNKRVIDSNKTVTSMNFIGVNGFFDAQYVRAGLGMKFSVGGVKTKTKDTNETDKKISATMFDISILGKYPFDLGMAKIYPMAGFDFSFNLSAKNDGKDVKEGMSDEMKKNFNHYFFVAGLGADIGLTDKLYLTPTMLFGIDMKKPSNYEDTKKFYDTAGVKYKDNYFMFNVGFGVGYKF